MVKKALTAFLTVLFAISLCASADTINPAIKDANGYVTVSGKIEADSYPQRVTVAVLKNGTDPDSLSDVTTIEELFAKMNYYRETVTDSEGNYSVKYKMSGDTAWYDVRVNWGDNSLDEAEYEKCFIYVKEEDTANYLKELNKTTLTAEEAAQFIYTNYDYLGLEKSIFKEITADDQTVIAEDFLKTREFFYENTFSTLQEVNKAFCLSVLTYAVNNAADSQKTAEQIEQYGSVSTLGDASFFKLYEDNKSSVCNALYEAKPLDADKLFSVVGDECILSGIANVKTYNEVETILTDNYEYLDISLDAYMGIYDRSSINKALIQKYSSVDELVSRFKLLVSANKYKNPTSGGSGSGSGSGSGGASIGPVGISEKSTEPTTSAGTDAAEKPFDDMQNFEWAEESVNYLAAKGIVAGVGNNKFEPWRAVTREEFVKMIIEAFYEIDKTAEAYFGDVGREMWSYSYIATAFKLNIVKGTETGFKPGENIKREDAAVILSRIYDTDVNKKLNFADEQDISPYAKDAVNKLSALGIINGDLNGKFNPGNTATRAEAAKMIYGMLVNVKGEGK